MTIEQVKCKLQSMLTPKRFAHSLAVRDASIRLAQHYGVDEHKAAAAGLLHDCAKGLSEEQLLKLADEFGILIDSIQKSEAGLLHAPIGAELARKEFDVHDREILTAIRYHTTGCEDMGLLAKIICLADFIAEGRNFPEVEDLRRIAFADLDAALLMGMDLTIKHVISKGSLIHPDTVKARNNLILRNPQPGIKACD